MTEPGTRAQFHLSPFHSVYSLSGILNANHQQVKKIVIASDNHSPFLQQCG